MDLKVLAAIVAAVFYASLLGVMLWPFCRLPLRRCMAFCRRRTTESAAAVVFFAIAIHCGATKSTNGNDRVASEYGSVAPCESENMKKATVEEMTRDAGGELRFTDFSVDTNAVHFAASLPSCIELPERKIDLYATRDVDTNVWELVGNYDIASNATNLVDSVPLCMFPFPMLDRLFLALGTWADLDGDAVIDAREKFIYGTSPLFADTDGDGLLDGEELSFVPPLNPLSADTDGDGYFDGEEVYDGMSPASYNGGSGMTIRYYYDNDDRLTGAFAGSAQRASSATLSPAGNPLRQTSH